MWIDRSGKNSPAGDSSLIQVFSPKGEIVYVNTLWREKMGYTQAQLQKLGARDVMDRTSWEKYKSLFQKAKPESPPETLSLCLKTHSGELVQAQGTVQCLFKNHSLACAHSLLNEVGMRSLEMDTLEKMNSDQIPYRSLVENATDMICTLSVEGVVTSLNPAFEAITGFSRAQWLSKYVMPIIFPADRSYAYEILRQVAKGKSIERQECRILNRSGGVVHMECSIRPLMENQVVTGILLINRDITERRRLEMKLRESESKVRRFADATFEGIVLHDSGRIIESNERFAKMHGYEQDAIPGMNVLSFTAPDSRDVVAKHISQGFEGAYRKTAIRKDGSRFAVEVRGKSLWYKGRQVRVVAVRDLTGREKLYEHARDRGVLLPLVNPALASG